MAVPFQTLFVFQRSVLVTASCEIRQVMCGLSGCLFHPEYDLYLTARSSKLGEIEYGMSSHDCRRHAARSDRDLA